MHSAMPIALINKVNPFNWSIEFPAEMEHGGFNVIVANPPYIRIQNMTNYSPEEAAFYQSPTSPYLTARQDNFDKYALFIERALMLLRPEGRLGIITPHKFMTTQAGRALRRLITTDRLLEEVVHFGVKQVFGRTVTNYTCILVLDRSGRDEVRVEKSGKLEAWRYGEPGIITTIPAEALGEDNWQFADSDTRALFERVRTAFPNRLGQVAEIFVGVQTSADPIYIFRSVNETVDTVTLRWGDRDWEIERAILRPCLYDEALLAYAKPQANAWMIFPYELDAGRTRARARLIQPREMADRFPRCFAYLEARRVELDQRSVTGGTVEERQFYQFGRSQSLTKFDSPKIILPILSREARYAYDDTNIMVTGGGNGPYYMIRPLPDSHLSNHYLLAVLNHPLSEAFVRTNTSSFRGGYYSHGKQFIEDLPIPVATDRDRRAIEAQVVQMIDTLASISVSRTPHEKAILERQASELQQQIENCVTALFNLSQDDMCVVQSVSVPA